MIFNAFVKAILKSPIHRMLSKGTILLKFKGKKSRGIYEVPVNFIRDNETYLVTSMKTRSWWKNLREGVEFSMRDAGRSFRCSADVLEDQAAVTKDLKRYLELAPQGAKFFSVSLDENGSLDEHDIYRAAVDRMILRIRKLD